MIMKKLVYRGCSYTPATIKKQIEKQEGIHDAQLAATKNGKYC
tara:strand:- start:735 stop:863 length:129 start_codon:yes stop_codon:yes gene_type:complete